MLLFESAYTAHHLNVCANYYHDTAPTLCVFASLFGLCWRACCFYRGHVSWLADLVFNALASFSDASVVTLLFAVAVVVAVALPWDGFFGAPGMRASSGSGISVSLLACGGVSSSSCVCIVVTFVLMFWLSLLCWWGCLWRSHWQCSDRFGVGWFRSHLRFSGF